MKKLLNRCRRMAALLFAVCMALSLLPATAGAESNEFVIKNGVLVEYTGSGGDVTIPDGVISIGECAFSNHGGSITSVTMPNGVISIEMCAFSQCNSLISVVMPSSLRSIGESSFSSCTSLLSLKIPEGVETIGNSAFQNCFSLTSVEIPSTVTSIGEKAFVGCWKLTSLTIPAGVTSIGTQAFDSYCEIFVAPENSNYSSEDGVLFDKEKTQLIHCPSTKKGEYMIPHSVTKIGAYAFYHCALTSVVFPANVTEINDDAFFGCKRLTQIVLPDSLTSIGGGAFSNCEKLSQITIPNSVNSIGKHAFIYCAITSISIPPSVMNIGAGAFIGCKKLEEIFVDPCSHNFSSKDGVLFNKEKTVLIQCPTAKTEGYEIPANVKSIADEAFSGCRGLTSVSLPAGLTEIGYNAFWRCDSLSSIALPDGITSIGISAFCECTGLTSVTIPSSVKQLSDFAFSQCSGLTSVFILSNLEAIEKHVFEGCKNLTSVSLPSSVKRVEDWAFWGCNKLTDVYYGGSEAQWKKVRIEPMNDPLRSAAIHYNSSAPEQVQSPQLNAIAVTVNGSPVQWTDAAPFIDENSRTMVPLRAVGDALGLTVGWDGSKREASFSDGAKTIFFPIDSNIARTSDGRQIVMDTAAAIVNDRTYAPVRYLAEFFGHTVEWDGATRTVIIK